MEKSFVLGAVLALSGVVSACGAGDGADGPSAASELLTVAIPAEQLPNGVTVEVLQDTEGTGFLSLTASAESPALKQVAGLAPAEKYTALTGKVAPETLVGEQAVATQEELQATGYAGFCPTGNQDWGVCNTGVNVNHSEDVWTDGRVNFKVCARTGSVVGTLRIWKLFGGWNTIASRSLSNLCWTVESNPSVVRHYKGSISSVAATDWYDYAFWGVH